MGQCSNPLLQLYHWHRHPWSSSCWLRAKEGLAAWSPKLLMNCISWNSSVSVFYGSVLAIIYVAILDPSFIPNTPKSVWILQCPPRMHGNFETAFLVSHGSKMDCICWTSSLSLFHGFILMSIPCVVGPVWTLLSSQTPQNHHGSGSDAHTESMATLRQFMRYFGKIFFFR